MKMRPLLLILAVLLGLASCSKKNDPKPAPDPAPPAPAPTTPVTYTPDNSFKIVAYIQSSRDPEAIPVAKYKMITHLFFSFLTIHSNGDGTLNPLSTTQANRLAAAGNRARANGAKFGVAISGTSSYFVAMAANPAYRAKFIANVVAFAKTNNLDGVDMDWEYPSAANSSADDFVLLMKDLSAALHAENKFLSAAVTPGVYPGNIKDGIKPAVFPYVDFLNLMQYDGPNYDNTEPLNHASYKMTVKSMDVYLLEKGLPKEKAILGMPLYGEDAAGGAKPYRDIEASGADINKNLATVNGIDYGFNGIPLIKQKTQLAKDRGNGIMFWEFAYDADNANSAIKAANDQLGRSY